MLRSLNTAATGMDAQQLMLDVIANNLANANTDGFKKSRAEFQDLLYQTVKGKGLSSASGVENPTGLQIGQGTRPVATQKMYTEGELVQTQNQLDMAIEGDGFFQVSMPTGELAYTRAGNFKINSQGQVVTSDGYPLEPSISVPQGTLSIMIGSDGTVSAMQSGQTQASEIGQLQLAKFVNPAGLNNIGRNLVQPTTASGTAIIGAPGEAGSAIGTIAQGFLEKSNVKVVEEMINMIVGQRAFEINSKVVTTADQILRAMSQLK